MLAQQALCCKRAMEAKRAPVRTYVGLLNREASWPSKPRFFRERSMQLPAEPQMRSLSLLTGCSVPLLAISSSRG